MASAARDYLIAIDAGGTMTDAFVVDSAGRFAVGKALTNRAKEASSYLESVRDAAPKLGIEATSVHDRAVVSLYAGTGMLNTLLTRSGARVGLLVTRGNEHMPELERGLTWLQLSGNELLHQPLHEHTPELIDYRDIRGITERVACGSYYFQLQPGTPIIPLNEKEVRRATQELLDAGVEVIGIVFLFSYLNPIHEKRASEIVREVIATSGRDVKVVTSHELAPVLKEEQRYKSVLVQCYAAEKTRQQLIEVETAAHGDGYAADLLTLTAYGSAVDIRHPRLYETVVSGPVGGLIGSSVIGKLKELRNVVATDMGGTSFDVGLLVDGIIPVKREPDFAGHRLALPMVEIDSIGCGAGTAVRVNRRFKRVELGPDSAGADVGMCFRYPEVTISDLNVALGFLNPDNFLGGNIRLDRQAALEAIEERVAQPLGVDINRAAEGVLELLHGQMRDAIRNTLFARGYSPADYTLFAYGGAGPLHLRGIADGGFRAVATFPWAAAFSAFGVACCSIARRYSAGISAFVHPAGSEADKDAVGGQFAATFERLEEQARQEMTGSGIAASDMRFRYAMFARYMGHLEPLEVPLPMGRITTAADVDAALKAFDDTYAKIYTEAGMFPDAGYFITELVLEAVAPKPSPEIPLYHKKRETPNKDAVKGERSVFFGRWTPTRIYEMNQLQAGNRIHGPAIVEDPMTTLVVPPGRQIRFDEHRVIWYGR